MNSDDGNIGRIGNSISIKSSALFGWEFCELDLDRRNFGFFGEGVGRIGNLSSIKSSARFWLGIL